MKFNPPRYIRDGKLRILLRRRRRRRRHYYSRDCDRIKI